MMVSVKLVRRIIISMYANLSEFYDIKSLQCVIATGSTSSPTTTSWFCDKPKSLSTCWQAIFVVCFPVALTHFIFFSLNRDSERTENRFFILTVLRSTAVSGRTFPAACRGEGSILQRWGQFTIDFDATKLLSHSLLVHVDFKLLYSVIMVPDTLYLPQLLNAKPQIWLSALF